MRVRTMLLGSSLALSACSSSDSGNAGGLAAAGGAGGSAGSSGISGSVAGTVGTSAGESGSPSAGASGSPSSLAGSPSSTSGAGGSAAGIGGTGMSGGASNSAGAGGSLPSAGGSAAGGAAVAGAAGSGGAFNPNRVLCADKTVYAKCQASDFAKEDIFNNPKWVVSTWGNSNRKHSVDNLWVKDGILTMKVTGGTAQGQVTTGAEFSSTEVDFLYGSYRTMAKTASETGTVNSPLFYYLNDTSEIDVEILSQDNPGRFINYTIHQNNLGSKTHQVYTAGFDPSADFHEYRFDWTPQGVTYYIDGKPTGVTLTGNIPYQKGRILVNHWTLSDPAWGGGPPVHDAFMYVKYIEIYHD